MSKLGYAGNLLVAVMSMIGCWAVGCWVGKGLGRLLVHLGV